MESTSQTTHLRMVVDENFIVPAHFKLLRRINNVAQYRIASGPDFDK